MNKDNIKAQMIVKNQIINMFRIVDNEFISLTVVDMQIQRNLKYQFMLG